MPAHTCGRVGGCAGPAVCILTFGRLKDSEVEVALLGAPGAAIPSQPPPFSSPLGFSSSDSSFFPALLSFSLLESPGDSLFQPLL